MKKKFTILLIVTFCIILVGCDTEEDIPKEINANGKSTLKEIDDNMYDDYIFDGDNDNLPDEEYE